MYFFTSLNDSNTKIADKFKIRNQICLSFYKFWCNSSPFPQRDQCTHHVLWSCNTGGFATHASTGFFFTLSSLIFKPLTADSVFAYRLHMLRYSSCNYIYGLWTQIMHSECVTIPCIQTLTAYPILCVRVCVLEGCLAWWLSGDRVSV